VTDTPTPSRTPSATPSKTPSHTPSLTPSPTPSVTDTPTPSRTPSATPSATPSRTPTARPTLTPSVTQTSAPTVDPRTVARATRDALLTLTATQWTPTPSPTLTFTPTDTATPNLEATIAFELTQLYYEDATATATLWTSTPSPTRTWTPTATETATLTPVYTARVTNTIIISASPAVTILPKNTSTFISWTPSPTPQLIHISNVAGLRMEKEIPDSGMVQVFAFDRTDSILCYPLSNQIHIIDTNGFQPRLPLFSEDNLTDIAISPDDRYLAGATVGGVIVFENFLTELNPPSITYSTSSLELTNSVSFSPDGKSLYALTLSGNLYKWNIAQPSEPQILTVNYGVQDSYQDLQVIMNGNFFLIHRGTTVEVHSVNAWNEIPFKTSLESNIASKAFSDRHRLLALTDRQGSISVWQFDERGPAYGSRILYREYHRRQEYERAFVTIHPREPIVAVLSRSGLFLIDFSDPEKPVKSELRRTMFASTVTVFGFSSTGRYLVGRTQKGLQVWSVPWYAPKIQALSASNIGYVTGRVISAQSINVRSGPSQSTKILGQLDPNQEVLVTGRNEDGAWLQIAYNEGQAWVAAFLLRIDGDIAALPQVSGDVAAAVHFVGTVRDLTDDSGIPSAFVIVGDYTASGITQHDGAFDLQDVPAGEQQVSAWALYHDMPYGPNDYWFDPLKKEIVNDILMLPREKIELRVRLYRENTVTSMPDALVRLYRLDTLALLGEFTTDVNGITQPIALTAGPYLLEAVESNSRYYSIISFTPPSDDKEERVPIVPYVLQLFESPEMQSTTTLGMTVLVALEAGECGRTTALFAATAFDLGTGSLLGQELSKNPRILLNFATADTSGRSVIRYDAVCLTTRHITKHLIGFDVLEYRPGDNLQVAVKRYLRSGDN